jgi:hypothetical protein
VLRRVLQQTPTFKKGDKQVWARALLLLDKHILVGEHFVEPSLLLGKRLQLVQPVLGILAFILRQHTGINRDSHLVQGFN